MKIFELPFFGTIDVENITDKQSYFSIDFQGREITLGWYAEEEIDEDYFELAQSILTDLEKFDKENRALLEKEFENKEDTTVYDFLEFHLDELSEELLDIIDTNATKSENLQKLLHALDLCSISFHDDHIVPDYVLKERFFSDQVLGIYTTKKSERRIA